VREKKQTPAVRELPSPFCTCAAFSYFPSELNIIIHNQHKRRCMATPFSLTCSCLFTPFSLVSKNSSTAAKFGKLEGGGNMRGELHRQRNREEGRSVKGEQLTQHCLFFSTLCYTNAQWCLTPTHQWYKWSGVSDAKITTRIWTGGTTYCGKWSNYGCMRSLCWWRNCRWYKWKTWNSWSFK